MYTYHRHTQHTCTYVSATMYTYHRHTQHTCTYGLATMYTYNRHTQQTCTYVSATMYTYHRHTQHACIRFHRIEGPDKHCSIFSSPLYSQATSLSLKRWVSLPRARVPTHEVARAFVVWHFAYAKCCVLLETLELGPWRRGPSAHAPQAHTRKKCVIATHARTHTDTHSLTEGDSFARMHVRRRAHTCVLCFTCTW